MHKINYILILSFLFSQFVYGQISRGNNNQQESNNEEQSNQRDPYKDRFKTPKKVANCNEDLELEQSNNLIYHKRTKKPFTGDCVSYYDNRQMERIVSFVLGKENDTAYTYYMNGQLKVMCIYVHGVENGTWGYWHENGQIAWGNSYDMGEKTGEWLFYKED